MNSRLQHRSMLEQQIPRRPEINVSDILMFIELSGKREKAFPGWFPAQIYQKLQECAKAGTLLWSIDKETRMINGIGMATPDHENKIMFVDALLTTDRHVGPCMLFSFLQEYPGWRLTALRRDYLKEYNPTYFMHTWHKMMKSPVLSSKPSKQRN